MSLEGAKLTRLNGDAVSPQDDTILAHGNSFKFGYYMDCDVILMHSDALGVQCSIDCDAFGRVTIENRCPEQLITINGSKLMKKRPLLHNTEICILDKKFLWQFEGNTQSGEFQMEDDSDFATPSKVTKKAEQPPNSEPSRRWQTQFQRRLTIHSFAYCIKAGESPKDVEITTDENKPLNTYEKLISIDVEQATSKSPLPVTANLIDIKTPNARRRSNAAPKTPLSFCKLSETVITSYSPRETGVRPEKSFAIVQSPVSTPKKADASIGVFQHLPSPLTQNHRPSMHLIDLTTPKKRVATAVSPARTLLKSTLKKNIPSTPTNRRRHSIANTSATSMESVYSVPSTDDESVIELSDGGSCSPSPVRKTPLRRTPQSLMKHAILSSAKKAAITKRLQLPDRPTPSKILFTPPAASGVRFQSQSTPQRKSLGRLHLLGENDKASHSVKKTMVTSTPFRGVDTATSRRSILRSPSISLSSKNKSRQSLMLKQALKSPQTSSAQKRKSVSFSESARSSPLKSQAIKARKSVSFLHRIESEDNNQSLDCNEEKKPPNTRKDATFSPEKEDRALDPEKSINEQEAKSKINLTFSPPKGGNASVLAKPVVDESTNTLSGKGLRINVTFSPEKIADSSVVPLEVDQNEEPTVAAKPNIVSAPIPSHQQKPLRSKISQAPSKELELSEDFIEIDEEVELLPLKDSSCDQKVESLPIDDLSVAEDEQEIEPLIVEDSPSVEDDHDIESLLVEDSPVDDDDVKSLPVLEKDNQVESLLVEDSPVDDDDVKSLPVLEEDNQVESLLVVDSPDVEAVDDMKSTPVSDLSILDDVPTKSKTSLSPQSSKHIRTSAAMSTPCENRRSNINIIDDDDFEGLDSIFKTPKAMNIMILGTPKSIGLQKPTSDSVELVHSTEFDLSANLDDIFKTPQSELISRRAEADTTSTGVENIESYSPEEAFDMLVGRPITRKTYTPKVVAKQKEFSPLDGPRDTSLPKTDIEDWIDNVNQSIQLLQDDDSDEDEMSYLTANQSELSRDPLMMSAMSAGSINTTNKKKPIIKSAIDESAMTIMECDEDELEESSTSTKDPLEMSTGINQIKPQSPNISGIDLLDHTSESLFSETLEVSGESMNSNKTLECDTDENAKECTSELHKDINISPDKARREMEEAFKNFEKERKLLNSKRMVSTPEPKKPITRISRRKTLGNQTTLDLYFDVKVLKRERDMKLAFEKFEEDPPKVGERICKTPEPTKSVRRNERKTMGNQVDGVFNVEAVKAEREIELAFGNLKDEPEYREKRSVQTPQIEKKGMKDHRTTVGNSLVPQEKVVLGAAKGQLEMELAFENFEEDPEIREKREVKTPEPKKSSLKDHRRTMGTNLVPQEKLDLKAAKAQLEMELAFENFEEEPEISKKREVRTPEPKKSSLKDHRRTMGTSLVPQEKLDLNAAKAQREMELAFENFEEDPEIPEKREVKTPEPKKSSLKDHRRTMGTSLVPQEKLDLKAAKAQLEMELAFENFEEEPEISKKREVQTPEPKKSSLKDHRRTMGTSLVPQEKLDLNAAKAQREMELAFENFEEDPEIPEKREVQTPEPKKSSLKDHRRTMGTSLVPQEKLDLNAAKAQREMELAFENFEEDPEIPEKREVQTPEPKKSSLKDHRRTMGTSLVPQEKLDLNAAKAQREMELAFENFEEDPEIPEKREVQTPEPKKSSLKDHRRTMGTSLVPQEKLDLNAAKAQREMELAFENFEEDPEIPEKREVQTPEPKKSSLKDHRRTMGTSLVPQEKLDLKAAKAQLEMELAFENFEEDPEIPEKREVQTPEPKKSSLKDHRRTMGTSLVPQEKLDLKAAKAQLEMELAFENFEEDPEIPEKREVQTPEPKKSSLKDHRRTMGTSLVPQEKLDLKAAKAQLEMELAFENFEEEPEIPEKREVQTPEPKKSSLKDHRRTMGTSLVPQEKLDLKAAKAQLEMELAFENFEEEPEIPEKREVKTPEPKKSSLKDHRRTMGTNLVPQEKLDLKAAKAQLEMELAFENFEEDPEIPEKREVQTPEPKKSSLKDHRRTMGTSLVPQEKLDLKAAKAQLEMELAFENFEEDPEIPEKREVQTPEPKKSSLKDHRRTMGTSLVPQEKLDLKAAKAQLEMELAFENFEEDPEIPEKREVQTPEPKKSSLKDHRRTMGTRLVPQEKLDLKAAKAQLEMELAFENFEEDPEIPEKREVQTPEPKKSSLKDHRRTMGTSLVPQEKLDLKAAKAQLEMELAFENFEEEPEIPEKREVQTPEPKKSSLKDHRRTMGTSLVPQEKLDLKAAKAQREMELAFENFEEDPEIPEKREVQTPEPKKSSLKDHRRTMGTSLVPQEKLDLNAAKAQREMELAFENFEEDPEIPEKREVQTPEPKKSSLKDHRRTMGTSLVPQEKLDLKAAKAQLEMELAFENFEEEPEIPEKREVKTPEPKKSSLKDHRRTMGTSLVPQEKLDLKAAKAQLEMELAFENFEEEPEIPEKREVKTPEPKKSSLKDHRRTMGTSLVPQAKLDVKAAKAELEKELEFANFKEDPLLSRNRDVKTPEPKKPAKSKRISLGHRQEMDKSFDPYALKSQLENLLQSKQLALVEEHKTDADDENTKSVAREPKDATKSAGREFAIKPESGDNKEVKSQAPNKEDVSKADVTNTSQPKTRRRRQTDEDSTNALEIKTQPKQVRTKRGRQKSADVLIDAVPQDLIVLAKENTTSRKRIPSESQVAEVATHPLRKLRKKSTSEDDTDFKEDELTSLKRKITTITVAPSSQPEDGNHHHLESIAEEEKKLVSQKALLNLNAEADEISSSPNPSNNRIRGRRVQLSVVLVENKDDRRNLEQDVGEKSVQAAKENSDPPATKSDGDEIIPCTPAPSKTRGRRTARKVDSEPDSSGSVKQGVELKVGQVEPSNKSDLQVEPLIENPTPVEEEAIDESVPSTPVPTKTRGRRRAIRVQSNNTQDTLPTNQGDAVAVNEDEKDDIAGPRKIGRRKAVEYSEIRPEEANQNKKDVQDEDEVQGDEGSVTPKESANTDILPVAVEDLSDVQYKDITSVEVSVSTETGRRKLSETVVEDHSTPDVANSNIEDDGETPLENSKLPASLKTADSKAHKDESATETETECSTFDQTGDVSAVVKGDSMAPKAIETERMVDSVTATLEKSDVEANVNVEEAVPPKTRGRRLKLVENSTPQSSEVPKGRGRRAALQAAEPLTTNSIPEDDVEPIVDNPSSEVKAEEVVTEKSRGRRVKQVENSTPQSSEVPNGRSRRAVQKTDKKNSVPARKGNRRAALVDESHEKEEQHSTDPDIPEGENILNDGAAPCDDDLQQGEPDLENVIQSVHMEEATVASTNAATECSFVDQSNQVEVDSTTPPLTAVSIPEEDVQPIVDIPSSDINAEELVTEKSRGRRLKLVENSTSQSSEVPKGRGRRAVLKTEPKEKVPARKGIRRGASADTSHKEDSAITHNEAAQNDVDGETDLNSESVIPEDNPPPPDVDTQDDVIPLTPAQLKTRGRRAVPNLETAVDSVPSRNRTRNGTVEEEGAVVKPTADSLKPRGRRAHLKDEDTVHHDMDAQLEEVNSKEELSSKVMPSKTRGRRAAPKLELTETVGINSTPASKTTRRGVEENVVEVHDTAEVDKIDEAVPSTPVPSKTRTRRGALKSETTGSTNSMSVKKEDVSVNVDSTPDDVNAQQKEDDIEEVVLSTPEPPKLRGRRQILTAEPTKSKVSTPTRGRGRKIVDEPEVHTDVVSEPTVSTDASSHAIRKRGRKGAAEQETEHPISDKPSIEETIDPTAQNVSAGRGKGRRGATEQDPEVHTVDNDIEKVDQPSTENVPGGRKRGRRGAAEQATDIHTEDDDVEKEIPSKLSKQPAAIKLELIEAEPQDSDVHTDEVERAVPRNKRGRTAAIKTEPTESAAESSTPVRKRGRRGAAQEDESTATTKTEISDVDEVHSSATKASRARGRQAKLKLESTAESITPKNRRGNKAITSDPANQSNAKKSEEESNDSTPTPSKPETSKPARSRKASAKEISEEEKQPNNDVGTKPTRGRGGAQKKDKTVDSTTSHTEEEHASPIKTTSTRRKPTAKPEPEQSKPTRGRKAHTVEEVAVPTDDDTEKNTPTVDEEPPKKPTRGRKGLQVENIIAENSQPTSATKKTTRGRKPAAIESDDENSSQLEAHTKPTRTRKVQEKNEENPAAAPKRTNRRHIEVVTEDEQSTPSKRLRRKPNKLLNDEFVL